MISVSVQEEKLSFLRTVCRQVANTLNRKDPDSLLVRLGARQVSVRSPLLDCSVSYSEMFQICTLSLDQRMHFSPQLLFLAVRRAVKSAIQLWTSIRYCWTDAEKTVNWWSKSWTLTTEQEGTNQAIFNYTYDQNGSLSAGSVLR
jgi:hypothetical protein